MNEKKILILSNHFITLFSFRRELIKTLVDERHTLYLSLPKSEENLFFIEMGCNVIETAVDRRGINPLRDFGLLCNYVKIMLTVRPDIVFSYTVKPNIYGSIASTLTHHRQLCNITGTGATFLTKNMVSGLVKILYKVSVKRAYKVFFQNNGDKDFFVNEGLISKNYDILPGSGVNLDQYVLRDFPLDDVINFIFVGRIMRVKGIDQFLDCAQIVSRKYPNTQFYLAGFIEEDRYKPIIDRYHNQKIINYIGFQKDIQQWLAQCHCTILPSYGGEGVPNVLLESAAMGRICIASKINGSRDVIDDGVTGYLFEPGNLMDLVDKVVKVIELDYTMKKNMGLAGRKKVEREFDRRFVINTYMQEVHNA